MTEFKQRRIVYTAEDLRTKVTGMGRQISTDYAGKDLVVVGVLKGSLYFFADLTRAIDIPIGVDVIAIGTIPNTTSQTGIVRITKDLDLDIIGKHVLLIEDIIRTGLTTAYLVQSLEARKPASIKVCSLLVNPDQQLINVPIAYSGYEISDIWLIGYGMDVHEQGRSLPYIAELERKNT
ncbi:MAG: hypoxanthine phosphoribosyltransferase [Eubacteriales bacterium]